MADCFGYTTAVPLIQRSCWSTFRRKGRIELVLLGGSLVPRTTERTSEGILCKATAMLNEYRNEILCVRGNCDAEVDQMLLDFPILWQIMRFGSWGIGTLSF